jgi:DNA polymerase-4
VALYEGSGLDPRARLRLVGVRAAGLRPVGAAARQLAFDDRLSGWREAERAVDQIALKFGSDAVRPARLVPAEPAGLDDTAVTPGDAGHADSGSRLGAKSPSKGSAETRILGNEPGT